MRIDSLMLAVGGLGFLVFGLAMSVAPQATMASIGFVLPSGLPTTEVRAFYGGLELALAALLFLAIAKPQYRQSGLLLGLVCYGAVAAVRALGMIVDGTGGTFLWSALVIEAALALGFGWALWRQPLRR